MFNHPTILRVGYRALSQDYETDDFTGNKFRGSGPWMSASKACALAADVPVS